MRISGISAHSIVFKRSEKWFRVFGMRRKQCTKYEGNKAHHLFGALKYVLRVLISALHTTSRSFLPFTHLAYLEWYTRTQAHARRHSLITFGQNSAYTDTEYGEKIFQSQTRCSQGDYQSSHLKPCPIGSVRSRRTCECGRSVAICSSLRRIFAHVLSAHVLDGANPLVTYTMDTKSSQSALKSSESVRWVARQADWPLIWCQPKTNVHQLRIHSDVANASQHTSTINAGNSLSFGGAHFGLGLDFVARYQASTIETDECVLVSKRVYRINISLIHL